MPIFSLTSTVLGTPDPRGLAGFYQRLLGWPIVTDDEEWVTLRPEGGGAGLSFQLEAEHTPPVWPAGADEQQMQLHLDIEVDDLDAAVAAGSRVVVPSHRIGRPACHRVGLHSGHGHLPPPRCPSSRVDADRA